MVSTREWCVLISVLALAACGGDDGDGGAGASGAGGGGNDVGPDQICERIAAIQCGAQEACCTMPEQTLARCMNDFIAGCSDLEAIAADPIVGFNRAAVRAALDELETRAGNCDTSIASWAATADGLFSSFNGTRDAGESCLPTGGANTTDTNALGAALASCKNVATTACLPTSGDWTCAPRGGVDAQCFTDLNCQDGMYCSKSDSMATAFDGKCALRKAAGEACLDATECQSFVCASRACAAATDVQAVYCF